MLTSSRGSRAVRNGLVLGAAAAAAIGLTGCKAVPSFNLDSSASGIHTTGPSGSGGASGVASQGGSDLGAAAGSAAAGAVGSAPGAAAGSGAGSSNHPGKHTGSGSDPAAPPVGDPTGGTGSAPRIDGMFFGTTHGGYKQAVAGTGVQLDDHMYSMFNRSVPTAAMITVGSNGIKWAQVAQAAPGSSLYNDIVRWAQTLKTRGPVMLAYDHEPEASKRAGMGSPADYIAAYRHVESIFDQQGAKNIIWTWQMTANAFRVKASDHRAAANWYPGDAWVDNVGADAYNWLGCAGIGNKTNLEFAQVAAPAVAFARAHGKTASFPEWGSQDYPGRAQWLRNAQQFFVDNADTISAAFYFNVPPTGAFASSCHWFLTSPADLAAFRDMARNPALVVR
jgi:hypothetical protein